MNEVTKSRNETMTKSKQMNEFARWSRECKSKSRNEGIFFDRILLFSLCFFGRDDKANEQMNSQIEVVNAK